MVMILSTGISLYKERLEINEALAILNPPGKRRTI